MASFKMRPQVIKYDTTPAALGVKAKEGWGYNDISKLVKLVKDSTYGQCSVDDEIEGIVTAIEPVTTNEGHGFGTVQKNGRFMAIAEGALAIGDLVVAGTQAAVGSKNSPATEFTSAAMSYGIVKKGTPATFKWRVVAIEKGTGAGSIVTVEKV